MFGPGPSPNYAPPILQARNRDPRLAYFHALQQAGSTTAPVSSPLEAFARVAQAGIGGYFAGQTNKEYEERQKKYQDALAQAMGQTDPIAALQASGNADVMSQFGPQILQSKQQAAARAEDRAARAEERKDTQGFQVQLAKLGQDFQAAQGELQRAHAAAMQNNSFENQRALQDAQQRFSASQAQLAQAFQAGQQVKQQDFQAQQNQLGRDLQREQITQGRIPPGYRLNTSGQLEPIPGGEAARMAEEKAKTDKEQMVATDRMIRSVDDLIADPGRSWGTGLSSVANVIPATPGRDFAAKLDTLKSQAFLPAVAQLKGMGALSDAEGKKLTAAIGALEPTMSEGAFLKSLEQIRTDLLAARARMGPPAQGSPSPDGWGIRKLD